MRKRVHVVTSIAVGAGVVVASAMTAALGSDHGTSGKAEATRLVSYHGYRAQVPASWPVYDLSKDPTRCVRFDRHAVYLGTPGPDQHCPAHLVGRTEALLVQPLTRRTAGTGGIDQAGELHRNLPDAKVAVTASYRGDRSLASSLVHPATPPASTAPGTTAPAASGPATATRPAPSGPATPGSTGSTGAAGSTGATGSAAPPTDPAPPATATPTLPAGPTGSATATDTPSGTAAPSAPPASSDQSSAPAPAQTLSPGPSATASAAPSDTGTPSATSGGPSGDGTAPPDGSVPVAEGTGASQSPAPDSGNVPPPSGQTATLSGSDFTAPSALVTTGLGFDTCAAPSAATMKAWQSSSLDSVGVYIGGENRTCPDGNLSSGWVRTVHGYGYSFLPIYVGLQAPCNARPTLAKIDPARAGLQGAAAANTAAAEMARFGMDAGNVVYLDIEFYDPDPACTAAVLDFVTGWTRHMHALGYAAGVYGNATSVARDMAVAPSDSYAVPDALWFARWNDGVDVDATPYVPDTLWVDRRVKQYQAPHDETHGGVTINIDGDYAQGLIALPGAF